MIRVLISFIIVSAAQQLFANSDCGLRGSLTQRLNDCAKYPRSKIVTLPNQIAWHLVARKIDINNQRIEVWFDSSSGKVWTSRLPGEHTHFQSISFDNSGNIISEIACRSQDAQKIILGISDKSFGLPDAIEFQTAKMHGILQVFDMHLWSYWSASLYPDKIKFAYFLYGENGSIYATERRVNASIICIGR